MVQRVVAVASATGLHARPAALFVKAAAALPVDVTVTVFEMPMSASAAGSAARNAVG